MRFLQKTYVTDYQLWGIEQELERRRLPSLKISRRNRYVDQALRALCKARLTRLLVPAGGEPLLVASGGIPDRACVPYSFWHPVIPYVHDCWEPGYPEWQSYFERHRTRLAFLTAQQSVRHFQHSFPQARFVWMPECVNPETYDRSLPLTQRTIDVLELGRKYDTFHAEIAPVLQARGLVHLFEKVKGEIIFPTHDELLRGYAESKISICFPSSLTHPARSGNVETVTFRYFESMASGCLLVGKCPAELAELFGYSPMIEIERADQLLEVLDNIGQYQALVNRNYARLLEVGTVQVRVDTLLREIKAAGYAV